VTIIEQEAMIAFLSSTTLQGRRNSELSPLPRVRAARRIALPPSDSLRPSYRD